MTPHATPPSATAVRRRIAGALAVLLLAPPTLFLLVLRPIERDRTRHAAEADRLREELARVVDRYAEVPLDVLLDRERAATERIRAERDRIDARARTLRDDMTLSDVLASGVEGRIDFKVTLFEARDRLGRIAAEKGVHLPADLGIAETIASAEQAQMRLWQLASTVLLLERCIDTGIREITHVEALDPLNLPGTSTERPGVTVYPVSIRFSSSHDRFVALLRALGNERGFFALRSFWLRLPAPGSHHRLDGRVVALALRATPPPAEAAEAEGEDAWIFDPQSDTVLDMPEEETP